MPKLIGLNQLESVLVDPTAAEAEQAAQLCGVGGGYSRIGHGESNSTSRSRSTGKVAEAVSPLILVIHRVLAPPPPCFQFQLIQLDQF